MDQLTPIYRIEFFLDAIVNNSANDLDPIYRVEVFLAKIAGRAVETPQPLSRMEMFLAKLCGESVELPQPQSRTEQYLAAICGEDVDIPLFPIYRIEYWLDQWAQGGGLPEGIEKVPYIQTTGGSYIITPIYLSNDSEVEMDFEFTTDDAGNLFGCYKSGSASNNFSVYRSRAGVTSYTRFDGKLYRNADFFTARHYIVMNGEGLWIDGEQAEAFTPATFTADTPLYICALANSTAAKADGKIYRFKVVGVFDGIPVKKLENGSYTYGLYDKIGQVFYPSNGNPFSGE